MRRAQYLLEMNGVDVQFETNTQMPTDFLLRQLELREALEQLEPLELLPRNPKLLRRPLAHVAPFRSSANRFV